MILLFLAGFFAGVAVTLFVVAHFLEDRRGGLLRHDTPEARKVLGKPW